LGIELDLPAVTEGAAYGAALLAGVGIGAWEDVDAATATLSISGKTAPSSEEARRYDDLYTRYHSLYSTLAPTMHALSAFAEGESRG
jgi:xylulokinase